MVERTKYQQNIIKRYYNNQDAILTQRLGEQITELYLAEGKGAAKAVDQGGRHAGKAQSAQDAHRPRRAVRQSVAGGQSAGRDSGQGVRRPPSLHS